MRHKSFALRDLSAELARVSGNALLAQQPVTSWEAALTAVVQFVGDQRTIVILDEFQFLAAQEAGIGSIINRCRDPRTTCSPRPSRTSRTPATSGGTTSAHVRASPRI